MLHSVSGKLPSAVCTYAAVHPLKTGAVTVLSRDIQQVVAVYVGVVQEKQIRQSTHAKQFWTLIGELTATTAEVWEPTCSSNH
jgi:hypothetical protein